MENLSNEELLQVYSLILEYINTLENSKVGDKND